MLDAASGQVMWVELGTRSLHAGLGETAGAVTIRRGIKERLATAMMACAAMPSSAKPIGSRKAGEQCYVPRGTKDADGAALWHLVTVEEVPRC